MPIHRSLICALATLLMALCVVPVQSALAQASEDVDLPPAEIANDEGGPTVVTGQVGSANFAFMPDLWPDPTVVLMDATSLIQDQPENFIPEASQILGFLTTSLFPGPGQYRVNLPIEPTGATMDVDNDGQEDAGVQIFALQVSPNLIGNSYLQQLEQFGGLTTYLTDVATGDLTEGSFLRCWIGLL